MTQKNLRQRRRTEARLASLARSLEAKGWRPGLAAGWSEEETACWYGKLANTSMRTATMPFAAVCLELLHAHKPDTVRGNMYLVVSAGWLPDTGQTSYDAVQRMLVFLRRHQVVPMDPPWIVDNIRATIKPGSWSGLADYKTVIANS